jgi:hypothetical protein
MRVVRSTALRLRGRRMDKSGSVMWGWSRWKRMKEARRMRRVRSEGDEMGSMRCVTA